MFLGATAEENNNLCHSREITGLSPSGPLAHPPHSTAALAWAALGWLAAGIALGLVVAGSHPPAIGIPVAIGCGAAAAIASRRRHPARSISGDAPTPGEEVTAATVALGKAMADLDHPDLALQEMLREVAATVGSRTILLLVLSDAGAVLTLDHRIVDGDAASEPPGVSMGVADSGPLRMALASGVPVAALASADEPGPWNRLAAAHQIQSAAIVPLTAAGSQIGLLVVAASGTTVPRADLLRLRRLMPVAAAAIGAMLRLQQLARTTAQSARSARFRSDYASVVGHELRTPLTTILGVVKTLTRPELAPESADARDLLEMACVQGDRLKRLVEDMLAINQFDGGGISIRSELVSLPDIVERAIDAVSGARGLTTVRIQDLLPPVVLDPEHTKRVLVNLLANAVKHGEESPIEVEVGVDRAQLVLTVADHGPGLPTATAGRAFDAFTQLKRIEVDAYGGVGLGLSVSQGLVAAMGGAIHHQPTAGGGATFVVRLPFKPHPAPRPGI